MSARAAVLGTTELLEDILLHLPLRRLLLAKRVSRAFRDTITDSILIRKALWLQPAAEPEHAHADNHSDESRQGHNHAPPPPDLTATHVSPPVMTMHTVNPFLAPYSRPKDGMYFGETEKIGFSGPQNYPCRHFTVYSGPEASKLDFRQLPAMIRNSRSNVKDMMVTHPPLPELRLFFDPADARTYTLGAETSFEEFANLAIRHLLLGRIKRNWVVVEGGENWVILDRTVDEITGWEMLGTFGISH